MLLNELYKKTIINEGGNVSSSSPGWQGVEGDHQAEEIDLKIHNRDFMVEQIKALLLAQNQDFQNTYDRPIWSEKLLDSGKMFSGSSLQFFDIKRISTEDFLNKLKKQKVGDIDTQVDQSISDDLTAWLGNTVGKKIGNGRLIGYNASLSSLWQLDDPPVKIQIDYELGPYDPKTQEPTEWFAYSHSSDYDDMTAGIKGVFHKYINRALPYSQTSTKYVARVLKKSVKISDEPVTDSDYSFAVTSAQGGGLSKKYKPYINPETGEEMKRDGLPVLQLLDPSQRDYIQNLSTQFEIIYGKKPTATDRKLQGGFLGTIKLANKYLNNGQRAEVADRFLDILFGPGAQMITKDDPERDRDIKFAAIDAMLLGGEGIEPLKVADKMAVRERAVDMARDYEEKFKSKKTTKEVTEDNNSSSTSATPNYRRQGIKHIYAPGSTVEMKDAEFIAMCNEIAENGGTLDGASISLKVDGSGIRFGRDSQGRPFFMTSKVTSPLYKENIGDFEKYGINAGQDGIQLARTKNYDLALKTIVTSKFIQELPTDTIVQAEMLFNPMAEKTEDGYQFVNISYDPKKLGSLMTLVPITVRQFSSGAPVSNAEKIKNALISRSSNQIKIIDSQLNQKGIDVSDIINPVVEISDQLLAAVGRRGASPIKEKARDLLSKVKKVLSNEIYNSPKLAGRDQLGKNIEGIVIAMPSGMLAKITSQEMKDKMADKLAKPKKTPTETSLRTRAAVVTAGSFVGHIGHQHLVDQVIKRAKKMGGDPYVYISSKVGPDDPIPPELKLATWKKLYPDYENIFQLIVSPDGVTSPSPVKKIEKELVLPANSPYNHVVLMVGSDRYEGFKKWMDTLEKRMKDPEELAKYGGTQDQVEFDTVEVPRGVEKGGIDMSFSQCRKVLADPTKSEEEQLAYWAKAFDVQRLGMPWIKKLMDTARENMGIGPASPVDELSEGKISRSTRILNYLLQPINEAKSVVNEDEEKTTHPEDLVFIQGSDGAKTAIKELTNLTTDTKNLEISWKGDTTVVFGRDSAGKLIFLDYSTYQKIAKDKDTFSQRAQQAVKSKKVDSEFDGQSFGELANHFIPALENVIPKESKNAFWLADILWSSPPPVENTNYVINNATVDYYIKTNSEIGKEVNDGTVGGISIKAYIPGVGRGQRPPKLRELSSGNGITFLKGTLSSKPKITINPKLLSDTQSNILKHSKNINNFIKDLKDKDCYEVFKTAAKKTIESLIKNEDITSYIVPKFIDTLASLSNPTEEDALLGKDKDGWLLQVNGGRHGLEAVWHVWADIVNLKTHVKQQIDAQEYGGDVRAVTTGVDAHESYTFGENQKFELKDRLGLNQLGVAKSSEEASVTKEKTAVFCLVKANPPTVGSIQMMLKVAKVVGHDPYIFFDNTQSKEDPLEPSLRLRYIRKYIKLNPTLDFIKKYFQETSISTEVEIMEFLYKKGYRKMLAVVPTPPYGDIIFKKLVAWNEQNSSKAVGGEPVELTRSSISNISRAAINKKVIIAATEGDKDTFYQLTGFNDRITVDNVTLYDAVRKSIGFDGQPDPSQASAEMPKIPQLPKMPQLPQVPPAQPAPQQNAANVPTTTNETVDINEEWMYHYSHWMSILVEKELGSTDTLVERRQGHMRQSYKKPSTGVYIFRDKGGFDRTYQLNRIMMAAAMSDGSGNPVDMDESSWSDKYNSAHPYTDVEHRMMDAAFKTVGSEQYQLTPRKKSEEPDFVNKTSPIVCHTKHQKKEE